MGLGLIIYFQLEKNLSQMTDISSLQIKPLFFLAVVLLMPLNWTLEAVKWQKLLHPLARITFQSSLKSIVSGVFAGMFTPARIGEYGGRMMSIPEHARVPSMAATLYGSIAQNSIHVLAGIGLGGYFIMEMIPFPASEIYQFLVSASLFIAVVIIFFLFPYTVNRICQALQKFRSFSWLKNFLYIKNVTYSDAGFVLLISGLRYTVYFLQYYFILKTLGVSLSFSSISPGIAGVFLIQSALPLPPVLNFLGRGEISILVWQYFGISAPVALLAAILLWCINIVIPALAGYILMVKLNPKTLKKI